MQYLFSPFHLESGAGGEGHIFSSRIFPLPDLLPGYPLFNSSEEPPVP